MDQYIWQPQEHKTWVSLDNSGVPRHICPHLLGSRPLFLHLWRNPRLRKSTGHTQVNSKFNKGRGWRENLLLSTLSFKICFTGLWKRMLDKYGRMEENQGVLTGRCLSALSLFIFYSTPYIGQCVCFIKITPSETDVTALAISGLDWIGMGWISLGGLKYRAAYASNNFSDAGSWHCQIFLGLGLS